MGVTFRSGGYIKHVLFGGRTIKDGEAAAIWNSKGVHTQIVGPKRIWLINSTIRFLTRHKAESHQYLKVSHRDGRVEHVVGPATMYANPAYHDNVYVQNAYRLCSSSECVVTFRSTNTSANKEGSDEIEQPAIIPTSVKNVVSKRIIRGPTLFVPTPSEHVHSFSWSINASKEYSDEKSTFNVLNMMGELSLMSTIHTVDGFSFDASLILSYKISSLDKLIENPDPMKCLYNSLLFDSQTLGVSFSSELLKTKKDNIISMLSKTSTYPSLMKVADTCGLEIENVQVTTISICSALRDQIDKEQSLSANIRSEVAKKTHSYKIREMELEDQRKRVEEEAALKRMQVITNDKVDSESHRLKVAALERRIELEKYEAEAKRDVVKIKDEAVLEFLTRMKQMGVDLTKFMTSYGGMSIADSIISESDLLKVSKKFKSSELR